MNFTAVCHAADEPTEEHGGRAVLNTETAEGDAHAASLVLFLKPDKSGTFEYGAEYNVTITRKAAPKGGK
jgi:hypothetical protein